VSDVVNQTTAEGDITMMTSPAVERDGPPSLWTPTPRRTIANQPLRTRDDHVRLVRRRQYARRFADLAGGVDAYPPADWNVERCLPYGLSRHELRVEWTRQARAGWSVWELDERLRPGPLALDQVAA
jgi:hypothetical protein